MTILLREIKHSDIHLLRDIRNLDEVRNMMYDKTILTEEMQERWFDKISTDKTQIHLTALLEKKVIGTVYFKKIDTAKPEWGFYISPAVKGVGGSLMQLGLDFWFKNNNALFAEVFVFNERSIYLHQKHGFLKYEQKNDIIFFVKNGQ